MFSAVAGLGIDTVENVLLYHVIPGATITSRDALKANGAQLTTALGPTVGVSVRSRWLPIVQLRDQDPDDADAFINPFAFDITRHPNPHLGFGFGTHFCLGASLARFELTVLFAELSRRFTNLRPVTEIDGEANIFANAVISFTLGYDRR